MVQPESRVRSRILFTERLAQNQRRVSCHRARCSHRSGTRFHTAFPDLKLFMDDLNPDGTRVEFHWTLEGTNTGPGGTGKKVRISGYEEWKFGEDGLIEDSLGHFDAAEYQHQRAHGFSG